MIINLDFVPVSVNCSYRNRGNKPYLSSCRREFQKKMMTALQNKEKIHGKVSLDIVFCFDDKRKRDLDNLLKPLIDCLKNVVIEDDCMIFSIKCEKVIGHEKCSTTIKITPIN